MTFHGHIENGAVVLDSKVPLPDGTQVTVEPVGSARPTLAERFADLIGAAPDLQHDSINPARKRFATQAEWEEFVGRIAGSIQDETFVRQPQGEYEERESLD